MTLCHTDYWDYVYIFHLIAYMHTFSDLHLILPTRGCSLLATGRPPLLDVGAGSPWSDLPPNRTLTRALIGGAQPIYGWRAPVTLRYKYKVGAAGSQYEVHREPPLPTETLIPI